MEKDFIIGILIKWYLKKELEDLVCIQKTLKGLKKEQLNKMIRLNSSKITLLHFLLDPNSPSGNGGKWTHSDVQIVTVSNSEIQNFCKKIQKRLNFFRKYCTGPVIELVILHHLYKESSGEKHNFDFGKWLLEKQTTYEDITHYKALMETYDYLKYYLLNISKEDVYKVVMSHANIEKEMKRKKVSYTVGPEGPIGVEGPTGIQGPVGISPYQTAVMRGFKGTEAEWYRNLFLNKKLK
jgi:hypothetical protein